MAKNTPNNCSAVYQKKLVIAEEPNYLFDYNITQTNTALEKSLNRERSAVGRTAYSDIIKKILLKSKSDLVMEMLISELKKIPEGTNCDEISLTDIQIHSIKTYNEQKDLVFVSAYDAFDMPMMIKRKYKRPDENLLSFRIISSKK